MNKKGFTLTELLAVIAIIGILSLIAIPNIVDIMDNIKRDNMLDDAKKIISLAKLEVNANYSIRQENSHDFSLSTLLENSSDIKNDPDGGTYQSDSYVRYSKNESNATYCIYLEGSKRTIGTIDNCVYESDLYSKNVVKSK